MTRIGIVRVLPRQLGLAITCSAFGLLQFSDAESETRGQKRNRLSSLVCADPEPSNDVAFTNSERAVLIADANHTDSIASFLKAKRRMMRVTPPQRVLLASELLHSGRKDFEALPEAPVRSAGHGRSRSFPARMSARTSSRSGRSLQPSAKSASDLTVPLRLFALVNERRKLGELSRGQRCDCVLNLREADDAKLELYRSELSSRPSTLTPIG